MILMWHKLTFNISTRAAQLKEFSTQSPKQEFFEFYKAMFPLTY